MITTAGKGTPPRGLVYRTIVLFGAVNSLLFFITGRPYFSFDPSSRAEAVFRYAAFFAHFLLIALILAGVLSALYLLLRAGWLIRILSVILFSLAQVFIFVDVRVYTHFKFHLSGIVLNAMTTPGYWDSVRFSARDRVLAGLAAIVLITAESLIFTLIFRRLRRKGRLWRVSRPRLILISAGLVILLSLVEKLSFGISDYYGYTPITRYQKILPFYRPFTFKRLLGGHFGEAAPIIPAASRLAYPGPAFRYGPLPRPYNVVIILVESLRFDMLDPEIMPNLTAFSEKAITGLSHYSGGPTSRFGGFALFYGLYGTYWQPMLNHRQGPVLIKQLLHNGYLFKVMSSTSLSFPEFDRTAFADLDIEIEDRLPGEDSADRDEILVRRFLEWLAGVPPGKPFFCFLFLDSPHATYHFPDGFRKFEPCSGEISFLETDLRENRGEIFNRYRNSIHYADYNLGRILTALEEGGYLENTVIVITGDHGQEFWEEGYYGHNSAYDDYQVRVPLVFRAPGFEGPRVLTARSSHLDVPGTILGILGDPNDPALYTLGENLFELPAERCLLLAGWDDCCLMTPELRMRFSTEAYNMLESDIRDNDYAPVTDRDLIRREKDRYLLPALEGMGRFLR
ncbi:MAG: sulfatase-like hydrolase/transferase [PVC group bacterium]